MNLETPEGYPGFASGGPSHDRGPRVSGQGEDNRRGRRPHNDTTRLLTPKGVGGFFVSEGLASI